MAGRRSLVLLLATLAASGLAAQRSPVPSPESVLGFAPGAALMLPWARLALEAAVAARKPKRSSA